MPTAMKKARAVSRRQRTASIATMVASLMIGAAGPQPTGDVHAPVFFRTWSANLDPAALTAIKHVAGVLRQSPSDAVQVVGYADLDGSATANRLLSETRAQVVTDRLLLDGVEAARIHQQGSGATGTDQHAQESRRVILIVSQH